MHRSGFNSEEGDFPTNLAMGAVNSTLVSFGHPMMSPRSEKSDSFNKKVIQSRPFQALMLWLTVLVFIFGGGAIMEILERDNDPRLRFDPFQNEHAELFRLGLNETMIKAIGDVYTSSMRRQFSYLGSSFLLMTAVTTVGYGNFVPITTAGRIFICVVALPGIIATGAALKTLATAMMSGTSRMIHRNKYPRVKPLKEIKAILRSIRFDENHLERKIFLLILHSIWPAFDTENDRECCKVLSKLPVRFVDEPTYHFVDVFMACSEWGQLGALGSIRVKIIAALMLIFLQMGLAALALSLMEGWGYGEALWFTYVTLLTIGFGDVVPVTWQGQLFCIFFVMVGLGNVMLLLDFVVHAMESGLRQVRYRKQKKKLLKDTSSNQKSSRTSSYETLARAEMASINAKAPLEPMSPHIDSTAPSSHSTMKPRAEDLTKEQNSPKSNVVPAPPFHVFSLPKRQGVGRPKDESDYPLPIPIPDEFDDGADCPQGTFTNASDDELPLPNMKPPTRPVSSSSPTDSTHYSRARDVNDHQMESYGVAGPNFHDQNFVTNQATMPSPFPHARLRTVRRAGSIDVVEPRVPSVSPANRGGAEMNIELQPPWPA